VRPGLPVSVDAACIGIPTSVHVLGIVLWIVFTAIGSLVATTIGGSLVATLLAGEVGIPLGFRVIGLTGLVL